jgi:hypothetical protein
MRRATILTAAILLGAAIAMADAPRVGVVTGTVKAPDGAPIPGATVQLISERGAETAISDAEGAFKFLFVIPDTYTVRADLQGFQPAEGQIVVGAGGRADVTLQLSEEMGEEIVVTGEVPLNNKFDVSTGGAMDAQELENQVTPARYYNAILEMLPEVTSSQEGGAGAPDIAGNTRWRTTFYVDGVDTSFGRFGGTSQLRLPTVAVSQIQLYTSRADAEFSRTMGGVSTVIVKSGTNDFRGDVSATFQNDSWNGTYDAFPGSDPPDDLDIRWEAAIGGPIVKDKLWFFAAAADQGQSGYTVLPNTEQVNTESTLEPKLLKFDFRPSVAHSLALTATETPTTFPYWGPAYADRYTGAAFEQGGEFATMRWNWAISDDLFLDTNLAYQKTFDTRDWLYQHPADPSAPPWSPLAENETAYFDQLTGQYWNAMALPLGPGSIDYPRYQGNLSLNFFAGDHDLKFGIDYQDTGWTVESKALPVVIGRGYNPDLPGGFVQPRWIRYYNGPGDVGGVENSSETWGVFVRDRWTPGNHWTFNVGLRLDDQTHWNDSDEEIFQSTDIAPRLTVVYDLRADSTLLVTAGAGRYYDWIPMSLTEDFNRIPQGRKEFNEYSWNPATQDFDIFRRFVPGQADPGQVSLDPGYKDEYTLGVEWAFHRNWAFKANALYYEQQDQYDQGILQVVNPETEEVANVYRNNPWASQERTSLTLLLRRRFRNNWTMTASYTWSETKGTCYNVNNLSCYLAPGELDYYRDPESGLPWSVVNRDGYLYNHLPHVIKVRGNYLLPLGRRHTLNIGGIARYQSGRRWQLSEALDTPGGTVEHFLEKAGSRELDTVTQLDLTASWRFPLFKRIEGSFTLEVINVTDEQVRTNWSTALLRTGDLDAGVTTAQIQTPRSVRALATISF